MSVSEKMEIFNMLIEVGFKEIEIGFPSVSQTEYDFLRKLIDEDLIQDDDAIYDEVIEIDLSELKQLWIFLTYHKTQKLQMKLQKI